MTAQLAGLNERMATGAGRFGRGLAEQGMQQIAQLAEPQKQLVLDGYRHAISTTFLGGGIIIALAFALVLFLPEHPLKTSHAVPHE